MQKNLKKYTSWGNFNKSNSYIYEPKNYSEIIKILKNNQLIASGNGRSYGDSSHSNKIIKSKNLNKVLNFDAQLGIIDVESGLTIKELLNLIIPHGWFIPVTPGTSYVTIGGCLASDVHGKNHHIYGTFSKSILAFKIILGNGEILEVSKNENVDLFLATSGGMGLTGIIISLTIKLKKINGTIIETKTKKTDNLNELINLFSVNTDEYSVAWINTSTNSKNFKSGIFYSGNHKNVNNCKNFKNFKSAFDYKVNHKFSLVNDMSISLFNFIYYKAKKNSLKDIEFHKFFYPLDAILNWNKIYGQKGFLQLQFVIPEDNAIKNLNEIFKIIKERNSESNLSVLKKFGDKNKNFLSFPIYGYSLTLDFVANKKNIDTISYLEDFIIENGGRINLCKDALLSKKSFRISYPDWEAFQKVREKYFALGVFSSFQSERLGLE